MSTTNFSSTKDFKYDPSQDLDAMANAHNYHTWIINSFKGFLKGKKVLEVGAGTGNFAKCLIESKSVDPENLFLLEPSSNLTTTIKENLKEVGLSENHVLTGYVSDNLSELKKLGIDCVIYNNVFEHIKEDEDEMKHLSSLLNKDGTVISFTPAMPFLYSKFDELLGHYRRYTLNEMVNKMERAGFHTVKKRYMDFWGVFTWFISFKLLKMTKNDPKKMDFYDKYIFPVMAIFDLSKFLKVGKNILVVSKKIK